MEWDRKLTGKILLTIRNIYFYYGMAVGHNINYGNYKFWNAYVCHSMNGKAHDYAFQFYGIKITLDVLFCINNLRGNNKQIVLHLFGSFFIAAAGILTYQYNAYLHETLSMIACWSYGVQMIVHMNENKVFKNAYAYLALAAYAFAFVYLSWIMIYLEFFDFSRMLWEHGAMCEWYFTMFAGYIHFLLLYTDKDFEQSSLVEDSKTIVDNFMV